LTFGQDCALLVARVGMASLFLFSGSEKLIDAPGAAGFAAGYGVPFVTYTVPIAAVFEIACALMIVSGWHARSAAVALALWMTVLNLWFHPFWKVPPQIWQLIIDSFFHHFVMIGAMIYLAVFGPGRLVIAKSPS
jgi:putative oxidoreductase